MANYSDFEVEFKGSEESIKLLEKEIRSYTNTDEEEFQVDWFYMPPPEGIPPEEAFGFTGVESPAIDNQGDHLMFYGMGKWSGPYDAVKYLAKKYELDVEYHDFEPGAFFYDRIIIEKGNVVSSDTFEYLSKEAIEYRGEESYLEEYSFITEEKNWEKEYKDVIEMFEAAGVSKKDMAEHWGVEFSSKPESKSAE